MFINDGDQFLAEEVFDPLLLVPGGGTSLKFELKDLSPVGGLFVIVASDDEMDVAESDEQNNTPVQLIGGRGCVKDTVLLAREPNELGKKVGNDPPGGLHYHQWRDR